MGRLIYITILCQLCIIGTGHAQYTEVMRSLRPGQAVNPWAVGENIFQIHAGGQGGWEQSSSFDAVSYNKYQSANAMLCYGISHKFELEATVGVRHDKLEINRVRAEMSGLNLAALGARYNIYDGGANGLSVGVQALIKIPGLSEEYKTTRVAPRVLALLGYNPSNVITLVGNLGIDYDGITGKPQGLYALKSSFQLSNKLGTFIETYGSFQNSLAYHHIDLGLYFFITNNLQIDVNAGMGVAGSIRNEGFIGGGISYRFSTIRNRHRWIYGQYRN